MSLCYDDSVMASSPYERDAAMPAEGATEKTESVPAKLETE